MADSAPSAIVTATPVAPAPMPPVINSITFKKLVGTVDITLPSADTDGDALAGMTNIKVFISPAGVGFDGVAPVEFPGTYVAGQSVAVTVSVPAYVPYDFEAVVSD